MSTRSLNKVMLIGNLTRDPEVRYTPQGTPVATFGLATNRSWTTGDGADRQEETQFHRIVAWSKLAEIVGQLLFKGRKVFIEGRLQTRKWTGQDGVAHEITEIVAENMMILDTRTREGGETSGEPRLAPTKNDDVRIESTPEPVEVPVTEKSVTKKAVKKAEPVSDEVTIDDIPF